jgi:O-antigen/teichoic acid export membrane protein
MQPEQPGAADDAIDPLQGVARHGAWHMAAIVVPGVYTVLLIAYLLRTLGPEAYGIWAAATALVGYLTLLDAGLSATTARAAARAVAGDAEAIDQVRTAYGAYAMLGCIAVLIGLLVGTSIPAILRLEGAAAQQAWMVAALLALDLGIVIATAGWMGTLRGTRRFREMLVVNTVQVAVAGLLLLVLLPPLGLVGAAAAQPVGRIVGRSLAAIILARQVSWFRARPRWPGWANLRSVTAFSLPILAMQTATQLGVGTDVIIVGAAAGPMAAGLYAAGAQLSRYVGYFLFPVLGVLLPSFSSAFLQRPEAVPELVRRAVLLTGLIGGTVYGVMAFQAEPLLQIWSDQSSALSVQVLILYALAWTIVTPTHVMMLMVVASGRHRIIGAIVLAEALVNLALSIFLVSIMGPVGAAISSFLVIVADDLFILPVVSARALQTRTRPILQGSLGGALGGITIAAAVNLLPVSGVNGLLLRGVVAMAALALAIAVVVPGSRALIAGRRPSG